MCYRLVVQCIIKRDLEVISNNTLTLCILETCVLRGKSADRSNDPTSDQHGTDMG